MQVGLITAPIRNSGQVSSRQSLGRCPVPAVWRYAASGRDGLLIAVVVAYGEGGSASFLFTSDGPMAGHPPWYAVDLGWVYVGWILIVIALYPMCKGFANIKAQRREWRLSYL